MSPYQTVPEFVSDWIHLDENRHRARGIGMAWQRMGEKKRHEVWSRISEGYFRCLVECAFREQRAQREGT